jgi:hypothetical protein
MSNPIYDSVCQEHGFDPMQQRAARALASGVYSAVSGFFRDLFGFSRVRLDDVTLAR